MFSVFSHNIFLFVRFLQLDYNSIFQRHRFSNICLIDNFLGIYLLDLTDSAA